MRLYAFLLLACLAGARAATIASPDTVEPISEKKITDVIPEKSENADGEQESIDDVNTIKDVENNLRVKPVEGIPVTIVEDAQPALKATEEEDDIVRPEPDLKNPGPPQRQLHETQNPEYHKSEKQQSVLNFEKNINDAEVVLRQGFQGVSEGIQHIDDGDKLNNIQQTIQALRDGFTAQINKLNESIYTFIKPENAGSVRSAESDLSFQKIELGLNALKNDFNAGVKTLAQGVDVVASLRDDAESPENPNSSSPATAPAVPIDLYEYLQAFQQTLTSGFSNVTQAINNYFGQNQGQTPKPDAANPPANAQADTPAPTPAPTNTGWFGINNPLNIFNQSGLGGLGQIAQNFQNIQFPTFGQNPSTQAAAGSSTQPQQQGPLQSLFSQFSTNFGNIFQAPTAAPSTAQSTGQSAGDKPADAPADPVTEAGPVKKLLQNNPLAQAVKRIQGTEVIKQKDANIVKPKVDVVKEVEKVVVEKVQEEKVQEDKVEDASKGYYGSGTNRDNISNGGLEEKTEVVKEDTNDKLPEEPKKEAEVQEVKQDESVKKTE